jgi:hypothetical protein
MRTPVPVVLVALIFVAATLSACGKKSPTQPGEKGLPGTWRATSAEYVSRANSSVRQEVVSRGTTMTLTLNANNTYTLTIVNPGQAAQIADGTWTASVDVLTLRRTGMTGESQFDMTQSGDTLTLTGGSMLYDFEGDGIPDEAVLNATFARQ